MKVILDMAVSSDGFVAKVDGDSNWVSPITEKSFVQRCKDAGCVIVGRKTFDQYRGEIYPVKGVINIVLTSKPVSYDEANVLIAHTPKGALAIANGKGFKSVLLAGGGLVSGSFVNGGLLNEAFLTFHPLILGDGIKLFSGCKKVVNMKLLSSEVIGDGVVQNHYKIN
ncbi:MAG: dihydrofolate reductase family protein [Nanoarchaeota archaeon]